MLKHTIVYPISDIPRFALFSKYRQQYQPINFDQESVHCATAQKKTYQKRFEHKSVFSGVHEVLD